MSTKYDGAQLRICRTGGHERVLTSSNVGQGASQACKGCWVCPPSTNGSTICRVMIGTDASATVGIDIPQADEGGPIFIPVSDTSQLYFYSDDDGANIDIIYLLG